MPKERTLLAGLFVVLLVSVAYAGAMVIRGDRGESIAQGDGGSEHVVDVVSFAELGTELPPFMQRSSIEEALDWLAQNGADLSRPMPSLHTLRAGELETAQEISRWALNNGFSAGHVSVGLEHGFMPYYEIELSIEAIPGVEQIRNQGE